MIEPQKKGLRFLHTRLLDERDRPAVCRVTRVHDGIVHYSVKGQPWRKMFVGVTDFQFCVKEMPDATR